jgi:hypothetical protein
MPSGEILLLRVAAHVLEPQYRDRRLVGQGEHGGWRGTRRRRLAELDAVDPHRTGDVLDLLLAHILEGEVELVAYLLVRRAAEAKSRPARPTLRAGPRC